MTETGPGELWVVRHGETAWSSAGRHTSTSELPLTEAGEASTERAADRAARARDEDLHQIRGRTSPRS